MLIYKGIFLKESLNMIKMMKIITLGSCLLFVGCQSRPSDINTISENESKKEINIQESIDKVINLEITGINDNR